MFLLNVQAFYANQEPQNSAERCLNAPVCAGITAQSVYLPEQRLGTCSAPQDAGDSLGPVPTSIRTAWPCERCASVSSVL